VTEALEQTYRELRPYAFAIRLPDARQRQRGRGTWSRTRFLRLAQAGADPGAEPIASPKAFLATITTRLAIDQLRSARARRESYFGPWLPEPVLDDGAGDLGADVGRGRRDGRLAEHGVPGGAGRPSPRWSARLFLLHDVFGYGYGEIAAIVRKSEANCRQAGQPRPPPCAGPGGPASMLPASSGNRLAERFFAACQGRDIPGLVGMLAADAVLYGDGGAKGTGINRPILGRDDVARMLDTWFRQGERLGVRAELVPVNGQPGALFHDPAGRLINVITLDIATAPCGPFRSVINPDKLAHLGTLSPIGRRSAGPDRA